MFIAVSLSSPIKDRIVFERGGKSKPPQCIHKAATLAKEKNHVELDIW
jgi:hypothetical protein